MANVESIIENQLLQASKIVEEQLDAELERLDKLGEDDLENIREQRLIAMKKQASKRQEWLSLGHGEYTELSDEKEFFDVCKKSANVICHFYRDSTFRCKIVDKHLSILAKQHIEARFVKLSVDRAPFLCQRLHIKILPTIALVKNGKTGDYIVGFDDLGGKDDFETEMLEWRIAKSGLIQYNGDLVNPPESQSVKAKKSFLKTQANKTIKGRDSDSDSD